MEKLELKHIAGYLPYGLKCLTGVYPILKEDLIWKILGLVIDKGTDLGFSVKAIRHDYTNVINIWPIKPILRPLSDLTKEIEVNGEKFIPLVEYVESLGEPCDDFNEDELTGYEKACLSMLTNYEMRHQQDLEFLQEHHFDYQELIEKGLAIDINTLNK